MTTASRASAWVCCQLGAREHYAIPRALCRQGRLKQLITDVWLRPGFARAVGARFPSGFRDRFHPDLSDACIQAFTPSSLFFEASLRLRNQSGWPAVVRRNSWFQRKVVDWLARNAEKLNAENLIVFSYSYAAREIFRFAKSRGWKTVLGQIDPGPVEEKIVAEEAARVPELAGDWQPAPPEYWNNWQEECSLADHIIVNSEWSRACLVEARVNGSKLSVIPLAYESPITDTPITRAYPVRFTRDRPLRVLFLGQINLRKGVARLLEAAAALRNEPVEFWMVGPTQCHAPDQLRNLPNVRWLGRAARAEAQKYYSEADVFLLPTLSDGFALTQLEAQTHGLPVIASRRCGEVVKHGMNGLLLDEPAADTIVEALGFCLAHPGELAAFSAASLVEDRFSIDALGQNLLRLVNT